MAFTATQYLFKASTITATTTATVGAYTVPASTRGSVIALTIANTATTFTRNYFEVEIWDGAAAYNVTGQRTPIDPGASYVVEGIQKHILPTGGGIYVTVYATTGVDAAMSVIEVT